MAEPQIRPPAPHGASPDGPVGGAPGPFDFPSQAVDWQNTALDVVRRYPIPCLVGAVAVGFWVGRNRGRAITTAAVGLATNVLLKQLARSFDASDI